MRRIRLCLPAAFAAVAVTAFAPPSLAADVCSETVPANRFIDGIPAYAQCAASMNATIYSNDGINTATTAVDTTWVRTQRTGGYQCTELANRYLRFRFNVTSVPNGNAGVWCEAALPAGLEKATAPVHGDLIVLAPGSCGADATTGHVAVIDTIAADMTSLMAVQQNGASRGRYNLTCAACFLHATANTGTPSPDAGAGDAGRPDAGGGAGTTGGAGTAGGAGTTGGAGTIGSAGTNGNAGTDGSGGTTGNAGTTASGGGPAAAGAGGAPTGAGGTGSGVADDDGSGGCAYGASPDPTGTVPLALLLSIGLGLVAVARRRRG